MNPQIHLAVSPHIHSGRSTRRIMIDVLIALLPTTVAGAVIFGWRSLLVLAVCIGTCILSEALFQWIVKKPQTVGDCSAAVTGLLLALNLPANIPLWQAAIGAIFAIVVVKCLFGGLGKNLVNPAITARVFMTVSFSAMVGSALPHWASADAVSAATPLSVIGTEQSPSLLKLLFGFHSGTIGEVCAVALLLGFAYLLIRRVITWQLPVTFVGVVFMMSFFLGGMSLSYATGAILSGGLLLGAIFMATDYVTSPSTAWGKVIFGVGAALITVLIRFWGNYPEGVSFAILLMNILTPYIDSWTSRKTFGGGKKA